MRKMAIWMLAAGVAAAGARADEGTAVREPGAEPVVLESTGIWRRGEPEPDRDMNRIFGAELAARGIEVHFISPFKSLAHADFAASYGAEGSVEDTRVTKVRSSGGDSPVTERVAYARCQLSVWRWDDEGRTVRLFAGDVIVPAEGDPPDFGTAVPKSLAEKVGDVVEADRLLTGGGARPPSESDLKQGERAER